MTFLSCLGVRAVRGSTALSTWRRGYKKFPKESLLHLGLSAYHGRLVIHFCGQKTSNKNQLTNNKKPNECNIKTLNFFAWNVCTLQANGSRLERRMAVIGHELEQYGIDIAALSETRLPGVSHLEE